MQHEIKRNESLLDWARLASEQSTKTRYWRKLERKIEVNGRKARRLKQLVETSRKLEDSGNWKRKLLTALHGERSTKMLWNCRKIDYRLTATYCYVESPSTYEGLNCAVN